MANTFEKITTVTVGSGGTSAITFSSIPQTYTDLKIIFSGRSTKAGSYTGAGLLTFNSGEAGVMNQKDLYGVGGTSSPGSATSASADFISIGEGSFPSAGNTSGVFGNFELYVKSYTESNYKSWSIDYIACDNSTTSYPIIAAGIYNINSAVTTVTIACSGGNWAQNTTATLYGIRNAAKTAGNSIKATGGNVSFYNQTQDVAILPTPVIGVLGVIDDVRTRTPMSFKDAGLSLYLIGETKSDFAGSEWAYLHGQRGGVAPVSDIPTAIRLNDLLVAGRTEHVFVAAHDLSQGGLAAVITEMTLKNGVGAKLNLSNAAVDLLSETPGRVLVAVKDGAKLETLCAKHSIAVTKIGETGGDSLVINSATISLTELRKAYTETLPKLFA